MSRPLTNFDPEELPIYEEAVRTSPLPGFFIVKAPGFRTRYEIPSYFSLHREGPFTDAGPFWRNFDQIRARKGAR